MGARRGEDVATSRGLVDGLLRYILTQVVVLRSGKVSRHRCLRGSRAFDSESSGRITNVSVVWVIKEAVRVLCKESSGRDGHPLRLGGLRHR